MARINRIIKISKLDAADEAVEIEEYRKGCLELPLDERVALMRELSRRIVLLNPANPRTRRVERGVIQIRHDPF